MPILLYNLELTEDEIVHLWFSQLMASTQRGGLDCVDESILKKLEQLLELAEIPEQ
jgi:hypothetical protein